MKKDITILIGPDLSIKNFGLPFNKELTQKIVKSFPFKLSYDQKKVAWEILKDMQKSYPMHRLLEGDVGTGKTAVAILISALVAKQNKQTVIMAPTEILASQHFETFLETLKDFELVPPIDKNNYGLVF